MKLRAADVVCSVILLCGVMLGQQMASSASPVPAAPKPDAAPIKSESPAWSPLNQINEGLPKWIRFSGQFRTRVEGYTDGGFNPANEVAYLLTRLWLNVKVQPTSWLKFYAQ